MTVVLLLLYALGGVVLLMHHHAFAIRLTPDAQVSTHRCGALERHIPLDVIQGCLACWQSGQRESIRAEGLSAGNIGVMSGAVPAWRVRPVHAFSPFLPDQRGPPVFA